MAENSPNGLTDNDDAAYLAGEQSNFEKNTKAVGEVGGKALLAKVGVGVIIVAFLFIFAVFVVIAAVFLHQPASATGDGLAVEYGKDNGTISENTTFSDNREAIAQIEESEEFQEYAYNPQNVLDKLEAFIKDIDENKTGFQYLTKDDMTRILTYVRNYQNALRNVTNTYTYYHHVYKKTVEDGVRVIPQAGDDGEIPEEPGVEVVGDDWQDPETGEFMQNIQTTTITDTEEYPDGHVINKSIENDPIFKVSWEEIDALASMASMIQQAKERNWQQNYKNQEVETPEIESTSQIDPETLASIINDLTYTIGYYFDPTSDETMPESTDTYKNHKYLYEEMDKYAYFEEETLVGEQNWDHGTETDETTDFEYTHAKKPATAPAEAFNAYCRVRYIYTPQADGTSILSAREITIDGRAYQDYCTQLLGENFNMGHFLALIEHLPGSKYRDPEFAAVAEGLPKSVLERFQLIKKSIDENQPITIIDTSDFYNKGVILGKDLDKSKIIYTKIEIGDDDGSGGGNPEYIIVDPADIPTIANESEIWNFLMSKIGNPYACAGIMGNLYAESGLWSGNMQNGQQQAWGMTDQQYTDAVNNGTWSRRGYTGDEAFIHDAVGYGIAQWTWWSRKKGLIEFARASGKSIDDLGMQLEYLWTELSSAGYYSQLASSTSVAQASDIMLEQFENPLVQDAKVHNDRRGWSQGYYNRYANQAPAPAGEG